MKPITWIEIPSLDLNRAIRFYEELLSKTIPKTIIGGHDAGLIEDEATNLKVSILCVPEFTMPSNQGVNVYFYVDDVEKALQTVEKNGGKIILPNTDGGKLGKFAWIEDSEGNRVAINTP